MSAQANASPRWQTMRCFLLSLACWAIVTFPAHGRWKARYAEAPYSAWFGAQKDCEGHYCCGEADGVDYYGSYQLNADGSAIVGGTKVDACKVLTGPNPTGHAILWISDNGIECFAPGSGS